LDIAVWPAVAIKAGFVPELEPQPGDIIVVKRTIGAFHGTGRLEDGGAPARGRARG
jgi:hypothetical protein